MSFPRLSRTEYLILDLLRAGGERYGLDLVKSSGGALKRGTVYVTLNRMGEKGFVASRQEKDPKDPGLPRRLYTITGEGARVLRAVDAMEAVMAAGEGGLGYA